jgi:hypothetical protein
VWADAGFSFGGLGPFKIYTTSRTPIKDLPLFAQFGPILSVLQTTKQLSNIIVFFLNGRPNVLNSTLSENPISTSQNTFKREEGQTESN